jgi:DEAD/DEAH box helicase domain-containing protein
LNAFLIGCFIADASNNATTLKCGWFFMGDGNSPSRCEAFQSWLQVTAEQEGDIAKGIGQLIARSILEGTSVRRLLDATAEAAEEIRSRWAVEHEALCEQLTLVGGKPADGGKATTEQRAVMITLERFEGEFLLRELAGNGFLPAHGFPLHVLPFVNTSAESLSSEEEVRQEAKQSGTANESRFRFRSYPSRELAVGIREYAPGNQVVIDGLSYTSRGLTLTWQTPPNDSAVKEIQSLKFFWLCKRCGAFHTSSGPKQHCVQCQSEDVRNQRYIQPSGFAVDIRTGPSSPNDEPIYVAPTKPRIACRGDWRAMSNPSLGSLRYDPDGRVFHHSTGATEFGYAVCLQCGRAASEDGWVKDGAADPLMKNGPHSRLRTGRQKDQTHICPGNDKPFSVVRNLWLGGDELTDVVQIRLLHPQSSRRLMTQSVATSLAVCLRQALAQSLGIEVRELAWSVQTIREDGTGYRDIFLFDAATGGAGYVAEIPRLLNELLEASRKMLKQCNCDKACHSCLLDFDTQYDSGNLDRKEALEWLNDDFLLAMQVPEQFQCYGEKTEYEPLDLIESIVAESKHQNVQSIRIFLNGDPELWEFDHWRCFSFLHRLALAGHGVSVSIAIPRASTLPWTTRHTLALQSEATGVAVVELQEADLTTGSQAWKAAVIQSSDRSVEWATFDPTALTPGSNWGMAGGTTPIVRDRHMPHPLVGGKVLRLDEVDSERPNQCSVCQIQGELNGSVSDFGKRFWRRLTETTPWLARCLESGPPVSVEYTDRYLMSPLSARLFYEVISKLVGPEKNAPASLPVHLRTMRSEDRRYPRCVYHNWADGDSQQQTLASMLKGICTSRVELLGRDELAHARVLRVQWADQTVAEIGLDQGMGFMQCAGHTRHDFSATPDAQAASLITYTFNIKQHDHAVPIYVMRG